MGYWSQDDEGHSFEQSATDPGLTWGDAPTDAIDSAIERVKAAFVKDLGRLPTVPEIVAGIKFSTSALSGLPATVEEAEQRGAQVLAGWYDREPDGYHREPVSETAKAFEVAYYGLVDPASLLPDEQAGPFRDRQMDAARVVSATTSLLATEAQQ